MASGLVGKVEPLSSSIGSRGGSFFLDLLLWILALRLTSISLSLLGLDVVLHTLEELDIYPEKRLVQGIGELGAAQSPLHGRDGRQFVEVSDL